MFSKLIQTDDRVSLLVLRLFLGAVFFPHGAQKVLGWFGGHGLAGTMGFFTGMGIPSVFAALAIAAEFLGSLGLIVGLLTRVAAFTLQRLQVEVDEVGPQAAHLLGRGLAHDESHHDCAEPACGRDGLQPGDAGA